MKPCRSAFTMAIYVLSTLLFMTLFINASEDKIIFDSSEQDDLEAQDENQTNILGLDNADTQYVQPDDLQYPPLNILNNGELNDVNAQNFQEEELQTPLHFIINIPASNNGELNDVLLIQNFQEEELQTSESNQVSSFNSLKEYILCTFQFLTIHDMVNIRNTCSYFQRVLSPNEQTMFIYGQMFLIEQFGKPNENEKQMYILGITALQNQQLYELLYKSIVEEKLQELQDENLALKNEKRYYIELNHQMQKGVSDEFMEREEKNKINDIRELDYVNAQNLKENANTMTLLHSINKNILSGNIFNQLLTIRDILTLRATCTDFKMLLRPNDEDMPNMVMFCNNFGCKQMDAVPLIWFDLKYFLNESYANALEKMEILNIKPDQSTILTRNGNIISWYNGQTQDLYQKMRVNKIANEIFCPPDEIDYNMAMSYHKCGNTLTKILKNEAKKSFGGDLINLSNDIKFKLKNIKMVARNPLAFAALLGDGSVVAFGNENYGGKIPDLIQPYLQNVKAIFSTHGAFAALTHDGSLFAWGHEFSGGIIPDHIQQQLNQNVKMIYSNTNAFVGLLKNGNFVAWGREQHGGKITDEIQNQLKDVKLIYSSSTAFVALLNDGSVVAWGDINTGGEIPDEIKKQLDKNVKMIIPDDGGFKALCKDDQIIDWRPDIFN